MSAVRLTLLTCTRNGSRTIREAIEAIGRQDDVPAEVFEYLLVDNGSTDQTTSIARQVIEQKRLNARIVCEPKPGKINALLTGFHQSRGQFISIIDDDNFIDPGFIKYTLRAFDEFPQIGIIGSTNRIWPGNDLPDWFPWVCGRYACATPLIENAEPNDDHFISIGKDGIVPGAGSTFRKEPVVNCLDAGYRFFNDTERGANIKVTGEDAEISWLLRSMGYRLAHDRRITLRHAVDPQRIDLEHFEILIRSIGAGSLGIDPFHFTSKSDGDRLPLRCTWQWQLVSKLKKLCRLMIWKTKNGQTPDEIAFRNRLARLECTGAIRRILKERRRYTDHIRQVASGEWTRYRVI